MSLNVAKMWLFPFVLQALMIVGAEPLNRLCPPSESIYPCTCKHSSSGGVVTCINASSTLDEAVSALKGYGISKLNIIVADFDSAPLAMFKGLNIEDLSISKLEVKEPMDHEHHYLQGLENSLTTLDISKSFKSKPLTFLLVSYLHHLKYLLLTDNEIPVVTKDWFTGGSSMIDTLIFERNHIKSVSDDAFSTLKKLRTFALAGNTITEVSRSMLPQPASHLSTLDLAYNKITSIPGNFFEDMPALRNVNFNYNALTTLSKTVMSHVWNQLLELSIEGNKLQCDDEIKWICTSRRISLIGKCNAPPEVSGKHLMQVCQ